MDIYPAPHIGPGIKTRVVKVCALEIKDSQLKWRKRSASSLELRDQCADIFVVKIQLNYSEC